ncbi:hypothetical protein ACX40Y_06815 [Sphingomonas sp. RS6]
MPATKTPATKKRTTRSSTKAKQAAARSPSRTGLAAAALAGATALGALVAGVFALRRRSAAEPGTVPTDLTGARHPDGSERAIEAFRPDPTAPVPAAERDALRPALAGAAAPTLVAGQADDLRRLDAAPS